MKKLHIILLLFAFAWFIQSAHARNINQPNYGVGDSWSKQSPTVVLVNDQGSPIGSTATYRVTLADFAPAATATDILTISGSATKIIKITHIQVTADATGAEHIDLYLYKRTAANTGGTIVNPPVVKYDSLSDAQTAIVNSYTANPSALGAGILIAGDHYQVPAATGNSFFAPPWKEDFGIRNNQPIILRGASELFTFNFAGHVVPAGLNFYISVEWTEEPI